MEAKDYISGTLHIENVTDVQKKLIEWILSDTGLLERVKRAESLTPPQEIKAGEKDIRKPQGTDGICTGRLKFRDRDTVEEKELELFSLASFDGRVKEVIFTRRGRTLLSSAEFLEDLRRAAV